MRQEKTSILVVVIVLLLLLILPASRMFTLANIGQISPVGEKNVWDGKLGATIPGPGSKSDGNLAKQYQKDYLLQLGISISNRDSYARRSAFESLLRRFPNEPSAYLWAVTAQNEFGPNVPNRIEENGVTPELAAKWTAEYNKDRIGPKIGHPLSSEEVKSIERVLGLLSKGAALDPGNGIFEYRKAVFLFALHRDDEAFAAISRAAAAPRFTLYRDIVVKAANRLFDLRGGFDPIGRSNNLMFFDTMAPKDRSTARMVEHFAFMKIKRGNVDGGIRLAMDEMNIGHKLAATSPDTSGVLLGVANCHLAGAALDPLSDKPGKIKGKRGEEMFMPEARYKRELEFLRSSGHAVEARLFEQQMGDCRKLTNAAHKYINSIDLTAFSWYPFVLRNNARVLAMCALALALWFFLRIITFRKPAKDFWDRRAAIASLLFSTLPLFVIIELLVESRLDMTRGMRNIMGALADAAANSSEGSKMLGISSSTVPGILHWSFLGLLAASLIAGFIVMLLKRRNAEGRRLFPTAFLLAAYMGAAGLVIERTYSLEITISDMFGLVDVYYLAAPVVLLGVYSLFRAINCRFSCVKQSASMTFFATLRCGAAVLAAVFIIVYAVLAPMTISSARQADISARTAVASETRALQSALK